MSKDKLHFRFNVGNDKSVCVEGGSGYGSPVLHDSVTISLRGITEKGKLGGREAVSFYVHRSEMLAIGMGFLDVAHNMAPETMWARSEMVASFRAQQRDVYPLTVSEKNDFERYRNEIPEIGRSVAVCTKKLHRRMHILQRAQHLLERVDDACAHQLDTLLSIVEQCGFLPIAMELAPVMPVPPKTPGSDPSGKPH